MRVFELVVEQTVKPKVGRAWQHAEDLIIVDGAQGALRALDELEAMADDVSDVSIKWDGSPAIYFGRDDEGNFVLTDKSGFTAKGYNGKTQSPKQLAAMLLNRAAEVDQSRKQFALQMAGLFRQIEKIVSPDFRGFVLADVLFFEQPDINPQGEYEFTPNTVTYHIPQHSDLGQRIKHCRAGIVMHQHNGEPVGDQLEGINSRGNVLVVGRVTADTVAAVDHRAIESARKFINTHRTSIDRLLDDRRLAAAKVSDFKAILYRFVNSQVTTRDFSDLDDRFEQWLAGSRVSASKQAKILAFREENPRAFVAIFQALEMIMQVKDQIIADLDRGSSIKQSVSGEPGGEGYVKGNIKLVPRMKFTAANVEKRQ